MKACGLIVEYNPFHNGHLYHLKKAKEVSHADCLVAVMSGSFLQRGEPAIIDKFHRATSALLEGADLVIELPYPYAVQSSELFAKGALFTLNELGVSTVCFGSESGDIKQFLNGVTRLLENKSLYDKTIRSSLHKGLAFPQASSKAFKVIGMDEMNMSEPNNILGFSYVKTILKNNLSVKPLTIQRINNHFHEEIISNRIASATSIRKELAKNVPSKSVVNALPATSLTQLERYKEDATLWHTWDHYFPFLHYQVMTMSVRELRNIHGVDEGLEHRIKKTAQDAVSFYDWLERIKTRRYTNVRLQRVFAHILTNTTKEAIKQIVTLNTVPYIRLLGMSKTGQAFLNKQKQTISVPIITNLNQRARAILPLDEKATNVYYSVLPAERRKKIRTQEFQLPIMVD